MKQDQFAKYNIAVISIKNSAHIYHAIPIAYELAKLNNINVDIFTDTDESVQIIKQLGRTYTSQCTITKLLPSPLQRISNCILSSAPRAKHVLINNTEKFKHYAAIVGPDLYINRLFNAVDRKKTKFIFTFHGTGDRSYGFKKEITEYDLLLLSGPDQKKRLLEKFSITSHQWIMCGYPKFDLIANFNTKIIFNNDRKTVLYTPHFQAEETSWFDWGLEVLEFFYQSNDYNLVFAPHTMLGKKLQRKLPKKYADSDHILVDLGSTDSIDMSHCLNTDIYLGDVSSQIYEFLYHPRPCIFLNSKQVEWQGHPDHKHWLAGDVLTKIEHLSSALEQAHERHRTLYLKQQHNMFAEKFEYRDTQSGERAAKHIVSFLAAGDDKS